MIDFFSVPIMIVGGVLTLVGVIGALRDRHEPRGRNLYQFVLGIVVSAVGYNLGQIVAIRDEQMALLAKTMNGLPDFYLFGAVIVLAAVQVAVVGLAIGFVIRAFFRNPPPLRWFRNKSPRSGDSAEKTVVVREGGK